MRPGAVTSEIGGGAAAIDPTHDTMEQAVALLHRGAKANDRSLLDSALQKICEGSASSIREALAREVEGQSAVEVAMRSGHLESAVRLMQIERDAADEISLRLQMLETKAAACDREAFRLVESRELERAGAEARCTTLSRELHRVEKQMEQLEERLHPPSISLMPDVIQLVALACCPAPAALAWCACNKDHHASRPPLRLLVIDDFSDARPGQECGVGPVRVSMQCGGGPFPAGTLGPSIEPIAQLPFLHPELLGGGLCLHVRPARRSGPYPTHVHTMLSRVSRVHAREITHLSLQMYHDVGLHDWSRSVQSTFHSFCDAYSKQLTSLRVLEVLHVAQLAKVHCSIKDAQMSLEATKALVCAVAPTLRSLSLVHTTGDVAGSVGTAREVVPMLRAVGPSLHYLSVFLTECAAMLATHQEPANAPACYGQYGQHTPAPRVPHDLKNHCVLDVPWRETEFTWEDAHWQADMDDEPEVNDDEIETEMLLNAAEGLCLALREPARVLAHVPPATDGQRMAVVGRCGAALASPEWLM